MKITEPQKKLIIDVDRTVKQILAYDGDDKAILAALFEQMPAIRLLIAMVPTVELDMYIQKYDGFYHYIKILEDMAQEIANSTIKAPR